jgi:hypothetical protein
VEAEGAEVAQSWRGYRLLIRDGGRFRWACSFHDPLERFSAAYAERGQSWSPDVLTVRPEDGPHRLLTVSWPPCRGPVVQPGLVRACIEEALRRGWLAEHPVVQLAGPDVLVPDRGTT